MVLCVVVVGVMLFYLLAQSTGSRRGGVRVRNKEMRGQREEERDSVCHNEWGGGGALDPDWRTKTGRRVMKCKHALSCHVRAIGLEFYN